MGNKIMSLMVAAALMAVYSGLVMAGTTNQPFTITANVPGATGATFTLARVVTPTSGPVQFTSMPGVTTLDFGTLALDPEFGIFKSTYAFAIDVAPSGTGAMSVKATYAEGTNQNPTGSARHGLGYKATATFKKVTGSGTSTSEADISGLTKTIMNALVGTGKTASTTDLSGGWLRVYVGIHDGASSTISTMAGAEAFSLADAAGTYTGTLTLSATVN